MVEAKPRAKQTQVDLDYGKGGEIERITSNAKNPRITIHFDKNYIPVYELRVELNLAPHELARLVTWLRLNIVTLTITKMQLELPEPAQEAMADAEKAYQEVK